MSEKEGETVEKIYQKLEPLFTSNGQGHVFQFWDSLKNTEKEHLIMQLRDIDPKLMNDIYRESITVQESTSTIDPPLDSDVTKFESYSLEEKQKLFNEGLILIAEGKIGILLLAGGQGTRLGFDKPKGLYVIDDKYCKKSLFQIQAERILRLQHLASIYTGKQNVTIPWYIMTSPFTYKDTKDFFEQHNYFGLNKDVVKFFNQDSIPCLSLDGKIIMESKCNVSMAPNGNGAVYQALETNNIYDHMEKHGVEYIHSYCVDNALVKVADPCFMALCAQRKADLGSKVVAKRDPTEKVGVFGRKNGKYYVVEYSEITEEMAHRKNPSTGDLSFNHSNIVNFFYSRQFLKECSQRMKTYPIYHTAKKKIPCVNEYGDTISPQTENGYKMELFNFDVCRFAQNVVLAQVNREFEFSPLKNATGNDSAMTCRKDLSKVNIIYLKNAGAKVIEGDSSEGGDICEISPLVTYGGEGLETCANKTYAFPVVLNSL